jgi:1-acyl-sn-glycerol-3-phosphate acyltransferase
MFPEGTRTRDGSVRAFKAGAFYAAIDADVPILPVTIRGSFERMKKGSWSVKPGVIELIIAPPIEPKTESPETLLEKTYNVIVKSTS